MSNFRPDKNFLDQFVQSHKENNYHIALISFVIMQGCGLILSIFCKKTNGPWFTMTNGKKDSNVPTEIFVTADLLQKNIKMLYVDLLVNILLEFVTIMGSKRKLAF